MRFWSASEAGSSISVPGAKGEELLIAAAVAAAAGLALHLGLTETGDEGLAMLAIVASGAALALLALARPAGIVIYFGWVAVQNSVLPWFNAQGLVSPEVLRTGVALKEVTALIVLAVCLLRGGSILREKWASAPDAWLAAYAAVLALDLVRPRWSDLPVGARLVGFRTLAMPVLFVLMGRHYSRDENACRIIPRAYLALSTAVALLGLFERLVLPLEFWSTVVGMGAYITDVKGIAPDFHVEQGLVANMFRFGLRRLVSVFGDPLACGYALILPIVLAATRLWRGPGAGSPSGRERGLLWSCFVLTGGALCLTINRGAIMTTALAMMFALSGRRRWWYGLTLIVLLGFLLLWSSPVGDMIVESVTLQEGSARAHFDHLVSGVWSLFDPVYVMGLGLGRSGFWAQELYGTAVPGIGENAFFMLVAQVGFLGLAAFLGFLVISVRRLRARCAAEFNPELNALAAATRGVFLAHLITGNTSENLFSFTGMAFTWFLLGLALPSAKPQSSEHAGRPERSKRQWTGDYL